MTFYEGSNPSVTAMNRSLWQQWLDLDRVVFLHRPFYFPAGLTSIDQTFPRRNPLGIGSALAARRAGIRSTFAQSGTRHGMLSGPNTRTPSSGVANSLLAASGPGRNPLIDKGEGCGICNFHCNSVLSAPGRLWPWAAVPTTNPTIRYNIPFIGARLLARCTDRRNYIILLPHFLKGTDQPVRGGIMGADLLIVT